ncbi:SDR family NAD(P)-dependent oxidoreductase [Parasphingorhabdus halotolerans]|uniref:SDR family oxidoreductase n=1 Tax=Parasphingorhabdus halotolerans TaxID=2725558 RepID=A0A6H2DM97_9SPHN|nr:SDR family NAD(P)-dependent oxidoreductase [Parasphingorhabdus halotolerans]QJB68786.1 SDR family oxidoreductase [Parasphingorhabdus halotolerans]
MSQDFSDHVAFITGGSDGIGRATAELLAERGATVIVCARGEEKLEATRKAIEDAGGKVEAHQLDVTDSDAFTALIEDVAERHGRLDMMVNNAMAVHYAPIAKLKLEHWRKDFAVNADAVFVGTKTAMKIMTAARKGSIVNISSTTAIRAAANMSSYSASKAALIQFTAVAAMEAARSGVRINAIVPGQVQTAGNEDFAAKAPDIAAKTSEAIPMGRGGEPKELAETILFMLSDAASYITGVALPVDGGKSAQLYLPS